MIGNARGSGQVATPGQIVARLHLDLERGSAHDGAPGRLWERMLPKLMNRDSGQVATPGQIVARSRLDLGRGWWGAAQAGIEGKACERRRSGVTVGTTAAEIHES